MIDTIEQIETSEASLPSLPAESSLLQAPCSPVPRGVFTIPPDRESQERFARLPDKARDDLKLTLKCLAAIHAAENKQLACRIASARMGGRKGFTPDRLSGKYYDFIKTISPETPWGDWTVILNKALAGPKWWNTETEISLPDAFLEFWRGLCETNQRKCAPAHRELLRIWRTHQDTSGRVYTSIPGYKEWPAAEDYTGIPKSWTYGNLHRRYAPDNFSLDAARHGLFAASQHSRKVLKTRVGLQVGEFYLFDDQEYDRKVNFLASAGQAQRRAMRPLGLNALDLFSADPFAYGFKPTLLTEEGTKQKLREIDMMWFVVHVLTAFGYNPVTGTTLIVEHGTAAIRSDFEERIALVTGGKVTVSRSGIHNQAALACLFEGAAKGNPRFKAPLESFFNLVRNEDAMLPQGQVGKDRNHSPDELVGRERENEKLLKAAELLSPEQAQMLRYPVLLWSQFVLLAMEIYRRVSSRIDHDLEGWEKAGLVAHEWRLDPSLPWMAMDKFLALPDPQQDAVRQLLNGPTGDALRRVRKLSPHEVFNAGATKLQRIPNSLLPELLGPNFGALKTVRDSLITIEDQEIDPSPMHFNTWPIADRPSPIADRPSPIADRPSPIAHRPSPIAHRPSPMPPLPNGTPVRCYLNPFNPTCLVVAHPATNAFIAELPRQEIPSWNDAAGIKRQLGAARHEFAERLKPMTARHLDRARDRLADTLHNNAVLNGQPMTPEQRHADRAFDNALATNIVAPDPITEQQTEKEYL